MYDRFGEKGLMEGGMGNGKFLMYVQVNYTGVCVPSTQATSITQVECTKLTRNQERVCKKKIKSMSLALI